MTSDDERREVARRLREVQGYVIPGTKTEVHPIAGRIIGVACGYELPDFQGLLGRLADLIEPSTQCPLYHSDRHYCSVYEDVHAIDRDDLLAMADEFESGARVARARKWNESANAVMAIALAYEYEANARRIREACGEESEG